MSTESLKETIKRELPGWLRDDPEFRAYVLELTRQEYAPRAESEDRFYEKHHQRKANRLIAISPMIDARAQKVAKRLGIETFGDSLEVQALCDTGSRGRGAGLVVLGAGRLCSAGEAYCRGSVGCPRSSER